MFGSGTLIPEPFFYDLNRPKEKVDQIQATAVTIDKKKYYFLAAILIAAIAGLISQYYSYLYDFNYAYRDAIYRMEAARRFFDSNNPGIYNQLGSVWLPIPNLILMPFAYFDYLWKTGLAASIVNLPLFVMSSAVIFLSVKRLTRNVIATWFGFLIFVFNCNILYYQTTAMTEQFYLTFLICSFYLLLIWSIESKTKYLIYSSVFISLGIGTRYDAWPVAIVSMTLVFLICILEKNKPWKNLLLFSLIPLSTISAWLLYNWIRFGDPLEFSRGEFSTLHQLKYYEEAGRLLTKNNFLLSAKVYLSSILSYSGSFLTLFAFIGLVMYMLKNKFSARSLPVYVLWVALPTTLILLYKGQLIIETPYSEPAGYFNSRYGLYLFPAIAVFSGIAASYLLSSFRKSFVLLLLVYVFVIQQMVFYDEFPDNIPALAEGEFSNSKTSENLSKYLKENYNGGKILYDNVIFALHPWTGIDLSERINFYTFELGEKAVMDPAKYVNWVLFYKNAPNDKIYESLKNNPAFLRDFELKFAENGVEAYSKK